MKIQIGRLYFLLSLVCLFQLYSCNDNIDEETAKSKTADHKVIHELPEGRISESDIKQVKSKLHIAYGHTSHGSQITTGMNGLINFSNDGNLNSSYSTDLFDFNSTGSNDALDYFEGAGYGSGHLELDAGYYPSWLNETQDFLDDSEYDRYNVIMWSWCGQVSSKTEQAMIDEYLAPMSAFEKAHPEITFIYMTGHLDGTGEDGNLNQRNEQIRSFCKNYDKWLFDFADIESHDPDGRNYLSQNADDACNYTGGNWATAWQNTHTEGSDWYDCGGAHTESINSNMKAYAAWWLFCRIADEI